MRAYTVVLFKWPEGGYSVSVPALKGCHTQGESIPEALQMAEEAVELFLETLEEHGDPVPQDVATVVFDWDGSSEALVFKLPIREGVAVA